MDRAAEIDWNEIRHFTPEEFDDPEAPGSWVHMDPAVIRRLDFMRRDTGWPIITHNKFGLRGCVCLRRNGHSATSRHYADHPDGCSAVDFHFVTDEDPRIQAMTVIRYGFGGVGIYYDWRWKNKPLKVGFHADSRLRPQIWKREKRKYFYLLQ